jgi:hypothetical protein
MNRNTEKESRTAPSFLQPHSIVEINKIEIQGIEQTDLGFFYRELKDCGIVSRNATVCTEKANEILVSQPEPSASVPSPYIFSLLENDEKRPSLQNVHKSLFEFTGKLQSMEMFEFVDTNLKIENGKDEKFPVRLKFSATLSFFLFSFFSRRL